MIKRPLVSACIDTISARKWQWYSREEGGIDVIDRGFRPGDIQSITRTQHGVISHPHTVLPSQLIGEALATKESTGVGTLVVSHREHHLVGLLAERDARLVSAEDLVSDRMTPRRKFYAY